jgi:hypothetical protein
MRVALIQDGARGHYGLATALNHAKILDSVYTDFYCKPGSVQSAVAAGISWVAPALGKRMRERYTPHLEGVRIRQSLPLTFSLQVGSRCIQPVSAYYRWASRRTGKWVKRVGLKGTDVTVGFVRNIDPDLCRWCRSQSRTVIGDQMIAPAATERAEMRIQQQRWPGWQTGGTENDDFFRVIDEVERSTWSSVDHLIAPSGYVKDELIRHGVRGEHVSVVNYAVDERFVPQDRSENRDVIIIGCMGTVGLRKGIPYFAEVAKRLARPNRVRFVAVGPVELTEHGRREAALANVELVGKVPRSESVEWLRRFDVFFFPTTCEGSAYVLMEAMATGLPIVTSPNSGTVARDGEEAFIAPYDAIDQHVALLERLIADRDLRVEMGRSAARSYRQFDMEAYSKRLTEVIHTTVQNRAGPARLGPGQPV